MDELSFSYNNPSIVDIFKSKEFNDIKNITLSFYFFLNVTIQNTLAGKKLFQDFDDMIDDDINNMLSNNSNEFTSKIDATNNKNVFKIIYLILFNKCKIEYIIIFIFHIR